MVKIYSNSKLWLYENCPEYYKIKYIDKTLPKLPESIHAYLGKTVHEALEWLYEEVIKKKEVDLDDFIMYFVKLWKANFPNKVRITNGDSEFFFNKGVKFLVDYFGKNKPFLDNTIHLEKRIVFPLDFGGKYLIQGYIDRVVLNENGEYEVHDYKTNDSMKTQEEVDQDRQLAFYHIGFQELFGKDIKVKLIWHFLAHNRKIISLRNEEQLRKLKEDTLKLIKKIESTKSWPACNKRWCDWCDYKRKHSLSNFDTGNSAL